MKYRYIISAVIIIFACSFIPQQKNRKDPAVSGKDDNVKSRAFGILEAKCNSCHSKQNPKRVFTHDNMDNYADPIYRQVFVWHRMPKNNATILSTEEQEMLKSWLRIHTKVKD